MGKQELSLNKVNELAVIDLDRNATAGIHAISSQLEVLKDGKDVANYINGLSVLNRETWVRTGIVTYNYLKGKEKADKKKAIEALGGELRLGKSMLYDYYNIGEILLTREFERLPNTLKEFKVAISVAKPSKITGINAFTKCGDVCINRENGATTFYFYEGRRQDNNGKLSTVHFFTPHSLDEDEITITHSEITDKNGKTRITENYFCGEKIDGYCYFDTLDVYTPLEGVAGAKEMIALEEAGTIIERRVPKAVDITFINFK